MHIDPFMTVLLLLVLSGRRPNLPGRNLFRSTRANTESSSGDINVARGRVRNLLVGIACALLILIVGFTGRYLPAMHRVSVSSRQ